MNEDKRLREILEPEPPRLSPEAVGRLEARMDEALNAREAKRPARWPLALAPVAIALALLLWFRPWAGDPATPKFLLLDEETYLSELIEYREAGGEVDEIFETDEDTNYEHDNWTDEDWQAFQETLEGFQLTDNGGTR